MDPHQGTGRDASGLQNSKASENGDSLQTFNHKPDDKTRPNAHSNVATNSKSESTRPLQIPISGTDAINDVEMEFIRNMIEDFGPDRFALFVYLGLVGVTMVSIIGFSLLSWSWITSIICVFIGFVAWRHIAIKREHPRPGTGRRWISRRDPSTPNTAGLPAVYFFYILGSGGHTTEMLETIRRKFTPQANAHRRYLFTIGDQDSYNRLIRLESLIRRCFPDARFGTIDAFEITRARKVHQPFWTAPLSCLRTAIHAVNALTREPDSRPATRYATQYRYPHVIVTNGPATGFIVCLVAHLLKVFYLAPQNRLKIVYVESWARSRTLSLTGRLFLWTGIADMFCVQHEELARRTPGSVYVGRVAARLAPPG